MPVTKKLVFNSRLLPDGHLECPMELAGKKNLQFKVSVSYETETQAPDPEIEYTNLNNKTSDFISEEELCYHTNGTIKEFAINTINTLPETATWEDIQERINFIAAVRQGLQELDEGKGIPHQKIKDEFEKWLSS